MICSILYLIERDVDSLSNQFDGLMLLPKDSLTSEEKIDFKQSLNDIINIIFKDIDNAKISQTSLTSLPRIRFDQLIFSLLSVATKFKLSVPPYFLNNARALASLEGMALASDPNFNLLGELYPYVLKRIIINQKSDKIRLAFRQLILHNINGFMILNKTKIKTLHDDILSIGGLSKKELYIQFLKTIILTKQGRIIIKDIVIEYLRLFKYYIKRIFT